jgi:hypothetical protein
MGKLSEETKQKLEKAASELCKKPFFAKFIYGITIDSEGREVMQLKINDSPDGVVLSTDNPQIFEVMALAGAISEDSIIKTIKSVTEVKIEKTIGIDLKQIPVDKPLADIMEDYINGVVNGINKVVSEHNALEFVSNKEKALLKISKNEPIGIEDLLFILRSKNRMKEEEYPKDSEYMDLPPYPIYFQSHELVDIVMLIKRLEVGMSLTILDFMDRGITASGPSDLPPNFESKNAVADYKDMAKRVKTNNKNKDKLN